MDKENVMQALSCKLDENLNTLWSSGTELFTTTDIKPQYMTGWGFWQDYYYPHVIKETYPVYLGERAKDKGKEAFEIIKVLKDKKFLKLETVEDFIDAMDCLIKIL